MQIATRIQISVFLGMVFDEKQLSLIALSQPTTSLILLKAPASSNTFITPVLPASAAQ